MSIDYALFEAVEYDEVVDECTGHLLQCLPPDFSQDARHDGYEPFFFSGLFPAAAAYELLDEEEPRTADNTIQPGILNIGLRFYMPSLYISALGDSIDASPRAGSFRELKRLYARFRENLYGKTEADFALGNFNMQGRVNRIRIVRSEVGDHDRLGNSLAVDMDSDGNETVLAVRHIDVRFEL